VQAGVVATEDGLPLALRVQANQDADALAAAAAAIGRLAVRIARELGHGELQMGVFDADQFRLLIRPLSLGFLLVVSEPGGNLGLIAGKMHSTAAALDEVAAAMSAVSAAPGGVS
jgi:predicted regulator of Ras-like GTPase activity (Roadblock/LC7/MglB family)